MKPTHLFNISKIISNILYAQCNAGIKFLGDKSDPQEKLITNMQTSGTDVSEDRIAALENRLREMEVRVKGLIDELLDFKAIIMTIYRQTGEHSHWELIEEPIEQGTISPALLAPSTHPSVAIPSGTSTVIQPRGAQRQDVPAAPADPVMVRIMQSDGTWKLEPRHGNQNTIDSSGGYGRNRKSTSFNR